ncbi:TetR/AcrR family transcriptional regulator [Acholeplasma equirhinis]|uniref:TetR/AcrR family transcriptional regulator n=1 Tax=Acholeplasma equirhinis TaxID=555393 RepID=UPI00197ACBCA|nr:TetR/AcrR family transcriptional regulator [Acholeplasma equirhinis]MBN3491056.1 TetR/AcrR family transcriptional regulator [Acholeplasma equirhinis]
MEEKKKSIREQQAQDTKKKILDAALKRFSVKGFHGTSIRDINNSIDVADGLLYHYFPGGKEELFKIISEEAVMQLEKEMRSREIAFESMKLEDILESMFQFTQDVFVKFDQEIKLIVGAFMDLDDSYKKNIETIVNQTKQWFPELLKDRINIGEIRAIDIHTATLSVVGMFTYHFVVEEMNLGEGALKDDKVRNHIFKSLVSTWKKEA